MDLEDQLNVRREEWVNLSEQEKKELRHYIIKYFRTKGFPHFEYSLEEQKKEMDRLDKYVDTHDLVQGDVVKQTMHMLGVCWSYHPHHWEIQNNNYRTPWEVFHDDELLDKAIKKRMSGGTHINEAMMRKTIKVSAGAQTVSNFRPSVARALYDRYCPDNAVVYDPCMGFGGRLIGAVSSSKVRKYIGCEPSTKTFVGLSHMGMNLLLGRRKNFDYEFNKGCAEDYTPLEKVDVMSTSPPYFNTEKYSEEETQSYKKFPTYDEWLAGFLTPMIRNGLSVLKRNGYVIINIANVKTAPTLVDDFKRIMDNTPTKFVEELKMEMSKQHSGGKFKYEPILVYRKK